MPGCCLGLGVVIILMGVGMAGEYYTANLHKFDSEKFEDHFEKTLLAEINQLQEYLEEHPEKRRILLQENNVDFAMRTTKLGKLPLNLETILKPTEDERNKNGQGSKNKQEEQQVTVVDEDSLVVSVNKNDQDVHTKKLVNVEMPKEPQKTRKTEDALGPMLAIFYMGYSAIPTIMTKSFVRRAPPPSPPSFSLAPKYPGTYLLSL